MILYIDLSI